MGEAVQAIGLVVSGTIAVFFSILLLRIIRGNANEYERNRSRAQSFFQTLRGKVPIRYDGTRDARVSAGIAVDRKTNEWIDQGRLSDEAIAAALRRPQ